MLDLVSLPDESCFNLVFIWWSSVHWYLVTCSIAFHFRLLLSGGIFLALSNVWRWLLFKMCAYNLLINIFQNLSLPYHLVPASFLIMLSFLLAFASSDVIMLLPKHHFAIGYHNICLLVFHCKWCIIHGKFNLLHGLKTRQWKAFQLFFSIDGNTQLIGPGDFSKCIMSRFWKRFWAG